jgi:hypothetical protein
MFKLLIALAVCSCLSARCYGTATAVKVLLVGSHARGSDNWITRESLKIENLLKFNGIPFEFFDVESDSLGQCDLDQYDGVVLEGYSMHNCATEAERSLLAQNMEAGNITVLLGLIHGEYTDLNSTLYDAMDVWVDGLENFEVNIRLRDGAVEVFDYLTEDGFVMTGGDEGRHVAIGVNSLGNWASGDPCFGDYRVYGVDLALSTWMENAFGVDARVTLPVISVRLDDTQTTTGERHQEVIDFVDANKHRIRASGFLVTDASAYHGSDSTLQNDEQMLSLWGSMSLHGKDHTPVGADGENRDYVTQYSDMNAAVTFLQEHFSRYKPMKASPMNSWNEATLHAMYDNGIYCHSACLWKSDDYKALYKSLFDVDSEIDRERMFARGESGLLRYYPLVHCDQTGEARIYSVDWGPVLSSSHTPEQALDVVRSYGLDWWTPVLIGAHFSHPDPHGANGNPEGWIAVMGALMDSVDHDSYYWRRWVDSYDLAINVKRFDKDLMVNAISVNGNVVTYDVTADEPLRFTTLRSEKTGYRVKSVTIDGTEYSYFGDTYVHLPEIYGNTIIEVTLTSLEDSEPHITHIDPSGVIEDAGCADGMLSLDLTGEFEVAARISGSGKVFMPGRTRVFDDDRERLDIDVSSEKQSQQVALFLSPSSGWVEAQVDAWNTAGTRYKSWWESAESSSISVDHIVGDLIPDSYCAIRVDGSTIDSCMTNGNGELTFNYSLGCSLRFFEIFEDSLAIAGMSQMSTSDVGLQRCYSLCIGPNPFESDIEISYHLPRSGRVLLRVYSIRGRLMRCLVGDTKPGGTHSVCWDGLDASGEPLPPGIYFCRLDVPGASVMGKIILIR